MTSPFAWMVNLKRMNNIIKVLWMTINKRYSEWDIYLESCELRIGQHNPPSAEAGTPGPPGFAGPHACAPPPRAHTQGTAPCERAWRGTDL